MTSKKVADLGSKVDSATGNVAFNAIVESKVGGFRFPDGTTQTTAATGGGGGSGSSLLKIVYLGDSLGGTPLWGRTLSDHLQSTLRAGGVNVDVVNCGKDAMTFHRANTQQDFGTNTAVQQTIANAPDVVIVALGANDVVFGVDGRSLAQVQADAATLLNTLKVGLPDAHIVFMRERLHDDVHVTPANTLNRHVIPVLHSIPTSGPDANSRTFGNLANATSAATRTALANLDTLFSSVVGNANVSSSGTMNVFRVLFFGCSIGDGVHPDELGALFLSNYVYKHLRANVAAFSKLKTAGQVGYHDFDSLFSLGTVDMGTYYSHTNSHGEVYRVGRAHNVDLQAKKNTWFLSTDFTVSLYKEAVQNSTNDHYGYHLRGGIPGQTLLVRIWQGAEPTSWTTTIKQFNTAGEILAIEHGSALGLTNGTYNVKYGFVAADGIRDVAGPVQINLY